MTQLAGPRALSTRAKFYLTGVEMIPGSQAVNIRAQAVSRGDRNANWSSATPTGGLTMTITNPVAAKMYEDFMRVAREQGKQPEIFLDICASADGWPGDGHAYREADIPAGIYGHGVCGECGQGKDAKVFEWSAEKNRSVETEQLVHPNG